MTLVESSGAYNFNSTPAPAAERQLAAVTPFAWSLRQWQVGVQHGRGWAGCGLRPLGAAAARSRDRCLPPDLSERSEFGRRPGAAPQSGASGPVHDGPRSSRNADDRKARDEGRGRSHEAKERNAASAAFRPNPDGTGFPGRSAASGLLARVGDMTSSPFLASHPGKAPSRASATGPETP